MTESYLNSNLLLTFFLNMLIIFCLFYSSIHFYVMNVVSSSDLPSQLLQPFNIIDFVKSKLLVNLYFPSTLRDYENLDRRLNEKLDTTLGRSVDRLPHGNSIYYNMTLVKHLFHIAKKNPDRLLYILNTTDPFGTKVKNLTDFKCDKYLMPTYINQTTLSNFKKYTRGYYIFFQHIRKAGGTSFCDLARANMNRSYTGTFYCMIDNQAALATPPWDNATYITEQIIKNFYRYAVNEYSVMYEYFLDYPGAIFATSLRHPVERWLSQYRFEHVERRDLSSKTEDNTGFIQWYIDVQSWTLGKDYYVKSFNGEVIPRDIWVNNTIINDNNERFNAGNITFRQCESIKHWSFRVFDEKYPSISWSQFERSVHNLQRFSLVLILEWLHTDSTRRLLNDTIGWDKPMKRILPHEHVAPRSDKKSIHIEDAITSEEYKIIARHNILDILFFEIAKRIYLERVACQSNSTEFINNQSLFY